MKYYVNIGILQVKIIFKQNLYLEIAGHFSVLTIVDYKYFLNGEKPGL